jgi:hypothetical protein
LIETSVIQKFLKPLASLKEAEDALEEPDSQEEIESEDPVEETVEITKTDLHLVEAGPDAWTVLSLVILLILAVVLKVWKSKVTRLKY